MTGRSQMLSETFLLDTFTVTARDIRDADLNALLALSISVGWSHRAEDWAFMRDVGHGRVAMDEVGRVHGAAMWFPFDNDHATIGMVITTPRLQTHGGGQWLMRHVLEQTQGRALGLHATDQSHRLFLSLGFTNEGTVYQHEGLVAAPPALMLAPVPDMELRALAPSDMSAVRALDHAATGWQRDMLLDALVARSRGLVLSRKGKVEGIALMRSFGRGTLIGPIIAGSEEDALRMLLPLIEAQKGRYVRIDTADNHSFLSDFIRQCGLVVRAKVTRMSMREPWPFSRSDGPIPFTLASQATG